MKSAEEVATKWMRKMYPELLLSDVKHQTYLRAHKKVVELIERSRAEGKAAAEDDFVSVKAEGAEGLRKAVRTIVEENGRLRARVAELEQAAILP